MTTRGTILDRSSSLVIRNVKSSLSKSFIRLLGLFFALTKLSHVQNAEFLISRDGSSKTGLYCCMSLLLERLKAENRIDVFQTVRSLQQKRPLMFTKFVSFF